MSLISKINEELLHRYERDGVSSHYYPYKIPSNIYNQKDDKVKKDEYKKKDSKIK